MIYLDKDDSVKAILAATFPEYKGRNIKCNITDSITFYNTNWEGGYRNIYKILQLENMQSMQIQEANWLNPNKLYTTAQTIPPECVVVCYTQGPRESITIFSSSNNLNQNKIENIELTKEERIVLIATRMLKNSYGGHKEIRYSHAHSYTGITRDVWDKTKETLIQKGYLTKVGGLTNKGKNNANGQLYDKDLKLVETTTDYGY